VTSILARLIDSILHRRLRFELTCLVMTLLYKVLGGPNDGSCVDAGTAMPFPAQTLALSRLLSRERGAAFELRISLVIATNPTTLPFTSFTGDKDTATCIRFPSFRTWMASHS